jgi:hypothetical protein
MENDRRRMLGETLAERGVRGRAQTGMPSTADVHFDRRGIDVTGDRDIRSLGIAAVVEQVRRILLHGDRSPRSAVSSGTASSECGSAEVRRSTLGPVNGRPPLDGEQFALHQTACNFGMGA